MQPYMSFRSNIAPRNEADFFQGMDDFVVELGMLGRIEFLSRGGVIISALQRKDLDVLEITETSRITYSICTLGFESNNAKKNDLSIPFPSKPAV
jgi:hypothetical protein